MVRAGGSLARITATHPFGSLTRNATQSSTSVAKGLGGFVTLLNEERKKGCVP